MIPAIRKFIIQSLTTAVICFMLVFVIKYSSLTVFTFKSLYFLIPFVTSVTVLFHFMLVKAANASNILFVNKFLAFSGIKLMVYMLTIIIYIFFIKFEPVVFLLSFVLLYLIFTVLEITSLLKYFKKI